MTTILPGHTYDIEGVGPAVIDEIRSINGEARIKALPLGAGDVPAVEMTDSRISLDELKSLFGDELPYHVVKILFPEKSEPLTLDELRVVLRALASPPSPVGADDGLVACTQCSGSGFSGYGSGYDAVCGECGGQKLVPEANTEPVGYGYSAEIQSGNGTHLSVSRTRIDPFDTALYTKPFAIKRSV